MTVRKEKVLRRDVAKRAWRIYRFSLLSTQRSRDRHVYIPSVLRWRRSGERKKWEKKNNPNKPITTGHAHGRVKFSRHTRDRWKKSKTKGIKIEYAFSDSAAPILVIRCLPLAKTSLRRSRAYTADFTKKPFFRLLKISRRRRVFYHRKYVVEPRAALLKASENVWISAVFQQLSNHNW